MNRPRTVRLEILRHGPPHNQLLSPLTQYLALSGNHPSVTVHVPYEHAHFLARHEALSYGLASGDDESDLRTQRELQLQITAQEMSQILAGIPGLISELRDPGGRADFTHFELVLSASELALLPFELANAPNGFPGSGQPIVLQSQSPTCITRRVNRVDNDRFRWPHRFKILFVDSLPDTDSAVLMPQHLLALRQAIDPWIGQSPSDKAKEVPAWVSRYLKVLRRASIRDIEKELSTGDYTHIHILAHGVPYREGVDDRFALQLRHSEDSAQYDMVSSSRLTALVRSFCDDQTTGLSLPAVITIASCHGAGQGSVVGAGSSIAHALHEADVPLVVSSQFPLSFRGSVLMVQQLYDGLLWGEDPRILLNNLRRKLKAQLPETHDWASLVAYAALPKNITGQLQAVRYEQILKSIEAAFSFSDAYAYQSYGDQWDTGEADESRWDSDPAERKELDRRLNEAKQRLRRMRSNLSKDSDEPRFAQQLSFMSGRLASTEKRQAEIEFKDARRLDVTGAKAEGAEAIETAGATELGQKWLHTLSDAQRHYREAFEMDRSQTWALVQCLVLQHVTHDWKIGELDRLWKPDRTFRRDYMAAKTLALRDSSQSKDNVRRAWAFDNLIELELLSLRFAKDKKGLTAAWRRARHETVKYVEVLKELVDDEPKALYWQISSTSRKLKRYLNWYYYDQGVLMDPDEAKSPMAEIAGLINGLCLALLKRLPESGVR